MRIHIKPKSHHQQELTLKEINTKLINGEFNGDEPAWTEGLNNWIPLKQIDGVIIPASADNGDQTETGPKGVGGWLLFFCILLVILGPLVVFAQIWVILNYTYNMDSTLKTTIALEMIGLCIIMIYGFIVGLMIWGGDQTAPQLARNYLLFRLCLFIALEAFPLLLLIDLPKQQFTNILIDNLRAILREISFFAIWWSYFKRSKRVKNTYGPLVP